MRKRQLTEREQEALQWARTNYTHWRKRWNETYSEHMAALPQHMQLPSYYPAKARREKAQLWHWWYWFPFGDARFNVNAMIVRRLLRERRV